MIINWYNLVIDRRTKMSRPKLYEKRIEVCVTPKQYVALKKWADNDSITVNQLIRDLIKAFINAN